VQTSIDRLHVMMDRERYAAYAALERLESAVLFAGTDGYIVHTASDREASNAAIDMGSLSWALCERCFCRYPHG